MQKLVTTNQIKVHPFSSSKLNSNCEIITNFKHGFQVITLNPKAHLSIPIIQHCFSNKYVINMQQMFRNLVPCLWQVQITFPLTIQTINTTIQSLNKELIVSCNSCYSTNRMDFHGAFNGFTCICGRATLNINRLHVPKQLMEWLPFTCV